MSIKIDCHQFKLRSNIFLPENPYIHWFPGFTKYCDSVSVKLLHRELCEKLDIFDVYLGLLWDFEENFRSILGQAEYWSDSSGKKHWKIRYASKFWLPIGEEGRRNTIAHEVCHLAVERLYGHCARPEPGQEKVLDHGTHWEKLMEKCGEDPKMDL
jgi:hypothetical protein